MTSWIDIRPPELNLKTRTLDTRFWCSILSKREGLRKLLKRRADKVVGADLFNSLYHWQPELKEPDEQPDPALAAWLRREMDSEAFNKLRRHTMGDQHKSAAAAVRLYQELMRPQESEFKTIAQTRDHVEQLDAMLGDVPQAEAAKQAIRAAQEKLAESIDKSASPVSGIEMNKYGQYSKKDQSISQVAIGQAIETATQDIEDAEQLADFGGKGYSLDPHVQGEKLLSTLLNEQLIARIGQQDKLRKILKQAGRMKLILEAAKSAKPTEAPPPVDLTYGADLSYVVGAELASMVDPDLEDIFWGRYLDRGLLQYEHKDRERTGKGPMVFCIDLSGSMSGDPEVYAFALMMAMGRMALKQGRKLVMIPFATSAALPQYITDAESLIRAISRSYRIGGGTIFETPLDAACSTIKTEKDYKKADIMFITDGISRLRSEWIEQFCKTKQELAFRVIGINITRYTTDQSRGIRDLWGNSGLDKIIDASSCLGRGAELSKLEWLNELAPNLVR